MLLNFTIPPRSSALVSSLQHKIDQKTKPLGSLGQLETLALQISLIQNTLTPALNRPCILVFAGDHGIVEAGVSAYPQTVTAQMVGNFLNGGAAISVLARQHGIKLLIVDAGVNADLPAHPDLMNAKVGKGTQNYLLEPAMSADECLTAIQRGAELVRLCHDQGTNVIGFGEMGIGNTSSAALLMHCLTGIPLPKCIGRGTGGDDEQFRHKIAVLQQVVQQHPNIRSAAEALTTFGGFEIAMMTGAYLQAAELQTLIVVDGFIATAALLAASQWYPDVLDYCVFSHVSNEQGHKALLTHLNARALLDLDMRLGEGSGIAVAYPLIQSAVAFLNEMASFDEAGVDH
jgi:nicotinate-nucleotide--dimethylbenzimidazole phosphoribosyltransferase